MKPHDFDTLCIHEGYTPEPTTHARAVPLYMTSAYTYDDTEHARYLFANPTEGNLYTRIMNPTTDVLEKRVAALEGGVAALAAASGHAAMVMTFLNLAAPGGEIVSAKAIYGGAHNMMENTLSQMGISCRFVDSDRPEAFAEATNERTRAWFIETIGNPNADIPDIGEIARRAHALGVPLVADNTVASPWLMQPLALGADIVIHSLSKFLSGNGTIIGGIVVDAGRFPWLGNPRFPQFNKPDESYHDLVYDEKTAFITKLRANFLRDIGACISPFNSWITLQGMETLSLRMERHCASALRIAEYLERHPKVARVRYPGLKSSPYYPLQQTYCPRGGGSVYSFDLAGGREAATAFCDSLRLISIVSNLGDARTLISCPAATTHSQLSEAALVEAGIQPGTIRLSVGLESVCDLLADMDEAFARL